MAGVWELVPGRSATEALCLLAMHHLEAGARRAAAPEEAGARRAAAPEHVEVQEVAALTGMATATAGAALRQLAKDDHLEPVPYLATASNGRPCARVGYRTKGGE